MYLYFLYFKLFYCFKLMLIMLILQLCVYSENKHNMVINEVVIYLYLLLRVI